MRNLLTRQREARGYREDYLARKKTGQPVDSVVNVVRSQWWLTWTHNTIPNEALPAYTDQGLIPAGEEFLPDFERKMAWLDGLIAKYPACTWPPSQQP